MNHSIYRKGNTYTIASNRYREYLEIEIPAFDLKYNNDNKSYGQKIIDCYGIIGIIDLINASYLVCIKDAELSFVLFKREIYKIKSVEFIPLTLDDQSAEDIHYIFDQGPTKEEEEVNKYVLKELKKTFSNDFYFSNKYDLANSLASHNQIEIFKKSESSNVVIDYDQILDGNRNFLANWKFINKLVIPNAKNNTRVFVSNCIYGNIESFNYDIKGENNTTEKLQIIVISRRNLLNYNLANYKRGLSKNGLNSNLIETEVIINYNNTDVYSHVFVSSYLPIFIKNKPSYTESVTNKAFNKYFQTLIKEYNLLLAIGLEDEENNKKYFDAFKDFLRKNNSEMEKNIRYLCIDSPEKTIKNILKELKQKGTNIFEILSFSHDNNLLNYKNDFEQVGTIYLLGMDERKIFNNENYLIQKVISNIYKTISKSNIKLLKNENFFAELTKILEKRTKELFVQYRPDMDIESIEKKQRMLDILFGKIEKDLKQDFIYLREEFSIKEKIKLFIGSWNAGSTNLSKYPDLSLDSWLIPKNQELIPNIYIVGFQEVVELNAGNIVLNLEDREKVLEAWAKKIENSIQKVGKYRKLIEMNLVGINIYCYCLEKDYEYISNLTKRYVKTGFGGAGNKGSCCINFNYYSTSISVACSHLAAGEKKNKQRLKEISEVLGQKLSSFVKPDVMNISLDEDINPENKNENNENENDDGNSILFKDSDVWILFGDLNFRIDMEYEEFSEFIKDGQNWEKLLEYDQFNKNQKASIEFQEIIDEDPIVHPPSYKYMLGTDSYDYDSKDKNEDDPNPNPNSNPNANNTNLSGKKRNPSWCDRIFYKKNTYITKDEKKIIESLGYYNCVFDKSFQLSDHRPIFNIFEITVFKDDEEKKKKIEKEVELNNKLKISSKYLQTNLFDN